MAKMFRPFAIINKKETTGEIKGNYIRYDTFRELKKDLKNLIDKSTDDQVHVLRSRRGQWGEWNEKYRLNHEGKVVKFEQGWS